MYNGRPVIGVTPLWDGERPGQWMQPQYMEALEAAGAIPLVLPRSRDREVLDCFLHRCDALVLTGGPDIDPARYGEPPAPGLGEVDPPRDEAELYLARQAVEADLPLLGICRGAQVLNVALGGTLWQDLPSQCPGTLEHAMQKPYDRPVHRVTLEPDSPLRAELGVETLETNSCHHQAVRRCAPCLRVMARAEDGVIEGAWHPGRRLVWAVQWHPERTWGVDGHSRRLFSAFVSGARG